MNADVWVGFVDKRQMDGWEGGAVRSVQCLDGWMWLRWAGEWMEGRMGEWAYPLYCVEHPLVVCSLKVDG